MGKKKANGEGSITKRKDGRYMGRYAVESKQKAVYGDFFEEVRQKLNEILNEIAKGAYVEPNKYSVEKWLREWLELYALPTVKRSTYISYEGYVRIHLVPEIGQIKLTSLTTRDLQKFFKEKAGTEEKKGLAPKTLRNIYNMLHSALDQAVADHKILRNPTLNGCFRCWHMLTEEGIPTPGKKTVWQRATVESILRNEKYKGSALLQKSFTVDFLTKKTKINEGEVPQYYVEDSHPAIIEPWEWEQVQVELDRRKNSRNRHHQTSPFSGKIICADCGDIFGAKTWHSTDRYRRVIWQCNGKFKGERKCETPHLTEERLKELYLVALGEYLSDRDAAIDQLRYAQRMLTDTDFIDADIQALEEELTTITGMLRLCIAENAANTMTEETYRTTQAELCNRFEETESKLAALQKQRDKMEADAITIGGMMFELGELDTLPVVFDEKLWHGTIDHVTVHVDERVVFMFKDGKEIVTML